MAQKKNKRNAIIAALAVLVVALAVGGTIAWLTAQDALSNTFTVGSFNDPGNEPGTDTGKNEDKDETTTPNTDGYLFETAWPEKDPKLTAGVAQAKNPNVGIGAGSDEAYVFLYVRNAALDSTKGDTLAADAPYFTLQKQWGVAVVGDANYSTASTAVATPPNTYVDGLFVYTDGGQAPTTLSAGTDEDAYTGELFETITMPSNVDTRLYAENPEIEVYAFIYAADANKKPEGGSYDQALEEAKAWADKIKKQTIKVEDAQTGHID